MPSPRIAPHTGHRGSAAANCALSAAPRAALRWQIHCRSRSDIRAHRYASVRVLEISQEVGLADLDAAMSQDVVRGRHVKKEVRQGEARDIALSHHLHLGASKMQGDPSFRRTGELHRVQSLE